MKAILVIDIDANELPKDAHANIYVFGKYYKDQEDDFIALKENVPLKPMPQKKKIKEIKHLEDFVNMETQYDYIRNKIVGKINYDVETIFNEGYNSCIDKILGEEE